VVLRVVQPSRRVVRCSTPMDDRFPRRRRGGRFIVLTGPDGVGKTTVARHLARLAGGATVYFHFCPPIVGQEASAPPEVPDPPMEKPPSSGSVVLGWARLARNFVRFWMGYVLTVRPAVHRGATVIGDRWAFGYLAQPDALKYYGPAWLARVVLAFFPRPDLVANLVAPADMIQDRKAELSIEQIERELAVWARVPDAVGIDASGDPELIARAILRWFD